MENINEKIKALEQELEDLHKKNKDLRKKNKDLRKENNSMLEKVEKYPCCRHIDKRKFTLETPYKPSRHNLPEEGVPNHAYCKNCDSLQPLFFGEITNTEMRSKCTWLCSKCCDVDGPCSFGPPYEILCEICLVKRKKKKEKNDERKRKLEQSEWYQIQKRNAEHNNRLLIQGMPKRRKPTPEQKPARKRDDVLYITDLTRRAHSPVYSNY